MKQRRSLQAWLQERQYSTPYHWHQRGNDRLEYQLRTRVVLELAGLLPDRTNQRNAVRVLDVGCGDARFLADAATCGSVIGVDVSSRALRFAKRLVPVARFVRSGGEALPFADGAFHVTTLLDVIEHIPDEDEARVIVEARRVLRPGGRLVISTNTDRSAREPKHYRHYPLGRFRELFDGFDRVEMIGLIPYAPTLRFWMGAPGISRLFRSRVRTCAPEQAQTVIGVGIRR